MKIFHFFALRDPNHKIPYFLKYKNFIFLCKHKKVSFIYFKKGILQRSGPGEQKNEKLFTIFIHKARQYQSSHCSTKRFRVLAPVQGAALINEITFIFIVINLSKPPSDPRLKFYIFFIPETYIL